jgi:hypothetical protein
VLVTLGLSLSDECRRHTGTDAVAATMQA